MNWRVRVRPEADLDLLSAAWWYEAQRQGLGREFLDAVRDSLRALETRALQHPQIVGDVRRALTRRFPYSIYYTLVEADVIVLAVLHQHRDVTPIRF